MEVKLYTPAAFYERYKEELLAKEAVYQLLLNNCLMAIKDTEIDCLIGAVEEEEKSCMFFQQTRPYSMLIYEIESVNEEIVQIFLTFLKDHDIKLNGINTSAKIVDLVLKLEAISDYHIRGKMAVMELRRDGLIEQTAVGKLVAGTIKDIELGLDWYQLFYQDCFNEHHDKEEYRSRMEKLIENKDFFFYEVEKEKVAMCAISRRLINGVAVSLVYTHPTKRGNSYCKQMMSELAKEIFARGYSFSCLFVDQENPVSNKAYKTVGYRILGDKIDIGFTI